MNHLALVVHRSRLALEVHKNHPDWVVRKKTTAWVVEVVGVVGRRMLHLGLERDRMEVVHMNLTVVVHVIQIVVGHKS